MTDERRQIFSSVNQRPRRYDDDKYYAHLIDGLHPDFVWRLAARNLALLVYLYLVCSPIVRRAGYLQGQTAGRAKRPPPLPEAS